MKSGQSLFYSIWNLICNYKLSKQYTGWDGGRWTCDTVCGNNIRMDGRCFRESMSAKSIHNIIWNTTNVVVHFHPLPIFPWDSLYTVHFYPMAVTPTLNSNCSPFASSRLRHEHWKGKKMEAETDNSIQCSPSSKQRIFNSLRFHLAKRNSIKEWEVRRGSKWGGRGFGWQTDEIILWEEGGKWVTMGSCMQIWLQQVD